MIEAVIFDMDGLLIDSEPFWRKSEIEIFGRRGITINESDCRNTTGMRLDEVIRFWADKFPAAKLNLADTEKEIFERVMDYVRLEGKAMPGVKETILFFKSRKIPVSIASASSFGLINAVVEKLQLTNSFDIIQSAEYMSYGKPHPEVFLATAMKLNVKPENSLVFEDSVFGVLAAKAARMKVIAVPDEENFNKPGYCIADAKISSLNDFNSDIWQSIQK